MISSQLSRLKGLGLAAIAGVTESVLSDYANALPNVPGATLAIHPALASPRQLAPLLSRAHKPGFVVVDMMDLEEFEPIQGLAIPDSPFTWSTTSSAAMRCATGAPMKPCQPSPSADALH